MTRQPTTTDSATLVMTDEAVRDRTGRDWEQWFSLLDEWGAVGRSHTEIARKAASELGIDPLAYNAQAVSVSYERARGLRGVGERADGFTIGVSRTVAVPVKQLFDAFVDPSLRDRWLPDGQLRERTASPWRSARFDFGDGSTRVHITLDPKGEDKSSVTVEHVRLPDPAEAERMKACWRERLTTLKDQLEGGGLDA